MSYCDEGFLEVIKSILNWDTLKMVFVPLLSKSYEKKKEKK